MLKMVSEVSLLVALIVRCSVVVSLVMKGSVSMGVKWIELWTRMMRPPPPEGSGSQRMVRKLSNGLSRDPGVSLVSWIQAIGTDLV